MKWRMVKIVNGEDWWTVISDRIMSLMDGIGWLRYCPGIRAILGSMLLLVVASIGCTLVNVLSVQSGVQHKLLTSISHVHLALNTRDCWNTQQLLLLLLHQAPVSTQRRSVLLTVIVLDTSLSLVKSATVSVCLSWVNFHIVNCAVTFHDRFVDNLRCTFTMYRYL